MSGLEMAFPMSTEFGLLGAQAVSGALAVFGLYCVGVFIIAILAERHGKDRSFLGEYFLGSRSLGVWAFALTFAATSASGGTFLGFPSLVYTHGWSVGLWIGGYMIVPLVSMGLLAKRMNQMARRTGAITIPDLLRERFASPGFGMLCTLLLVFFLAFNLIGQFKAGAKIIETLLAGQTLYESLKSWIAATLGDDLGLAIASREPGYVLSLFAFAVIVIFYTAYGGFRAVVWTDVMQGLIMVTGVVIMLPLAIWAVGGMTVAHKAIARMTPPEQTHLVIERQSEVDDRERVDIPKASWVIVQDTEEDRKRVFRTKSGAAVASGERVARWRPDSAEQAPTLIPVIEITTPEEVAKLEQHDLAPTLVARPAVDADYAAAQVERPVAGYQRGAGEVGTYVRLPGPDPVRPEGFLSVSLALSFFLMWTFSGAGQPGNMVRLLAFKDSRTLQRALVTMACYYALIYFPLVAIFVLARVLLPGWEVESDRIMPEMASHLTGWAGVPWLAGLLLAAPFAAVMSTMDSFLLVCSSAVTRDIYQRCYPTANDQRLKWVSVTATVSIGLIAMIAALNPPKFLQDLIVYTTSGLSTCFLAPVFLALYWRRFNTVGAFASMLSGFLVYNLLYAIPYVQSSFSQMKPWEPWGFHPFVVGAAASFLGGWIASYLSPAPSESMVRRFFGADETSSTRSP